MLMLSIATVLLYQGIHVSHEHEEAYFSYQDESASEVELTEEAQESLVAALAAALGGRARRRKGSFASSGGLRKARGAQAGSSADEGEGEEGEGHKGRTEEGSNVVLVKGDRSCKV